MKFMIMRGDFLHDQDHNQSFANFWKFIAEARWFYVFVPNLSSVYIVSFRIVIIIYI